MAEIFTLKSTDEVQLLGNFRGDNDIISNIVPCPDSDTAWISCSGRSDISLIRGSGEAKQKVADPIHQYIHQLTLGTNNELLMTFSILKQVMRFNCNNNKSSIFTSFPVACEPRGITTTCGINKAKTVIIGTRRHYHQYLLDKKFKQINELCSFDNQGTLISRHIFEEGRPERLSSSQSTSDIAVIAEKGNSKHSVVVLSFDLQVKFKYSMPDNNFLPTDIAFDIWNRLLICDAKSNSIHLVNEDGVQQLVMWYGRDAKLSVVGCFPSGLSWIGYDDGHVEAEKYIKFLEQSKYENCEWEGWDPVS